MIRLPLRAYPPPSPGVQAAYDSWLQGFLYRRLQLFAGCCLLVVASLTLLDVVLLWAWPEQVSSLDFFLDGLIVVACGLGLGLPRTHWGQRRLGLIFWGLSTTLTLSLLGLGLADELSDATVALWTVIFLTQATLVPVRWRLHLRSQLTLLIPLALLLLLAAIYAPTPIERRQILLGTAAAYIYLLWVCLVADLSIYLYERLRYQEFEAQQSVGTFLHAVSHDLRNPVTGSQILLRSLLNQPGDTLSLPRSLLEQMLQGSERQLALINSLLEVHSNRLELTLQRRPLQLHALVESVRQDIAPLLARGQVQVCNRIPPDLPPVSADAIQLWRVFHNLLINALHHNPPGITVWIDAAVENGTHLRCRVSDNGVGMSPEQCQRVFGLYWRGHRHRHLSVGLGLHIAQQIVTAHGGSIGASSNDEGSQFWFVLPLQVP